MKLKTIATIAVAAPAAALIPLGSAQAVSHTAARACYPPRPHTIDFSSSTGVVTHRGERVTLYGRVHGCGADGDTVRIKCSKNADPNEKNVTAGRRGDFAGTVRIYGKTYCAASLTHREGGETSSQITIYYRHHHHH